MSSKERKIWEKKQKENRIIDIAEHIFLEKGYEQTTLIEIANAAGYNKRTMYLYFKDREEIFLAVVLKGLTILYNTLEKALSEIDSKNGSLEKMGQGFFDFSLNHPKYLGLIMIYESNACIYYKETETEVNPEFYNSLCQQKTDQLADLITNAIEKGIKNKTIKTTLTPIQLMLLIWGQVFGVMQIILMRKRHFKDAYGISHEDLFNEFVTMMNKALS